MPEDHFDPAMDPAEPQSSNGESVSLSRRDFIKTGALALASSLAAPLLLTGETEGARPQRDVDVRQYGAKGDGRSDDTGAFLKAAKVAVRSRRRLFVPAGVYRITRLSLPDGLTLRGAGRASTWLKGHLDFGSNQVIRDLKIGDYGNSAVYNKAGATGTLFERVRFRGGGGLQSGAAGPVVSLGFRNSCSNITFRNCDIERNLGRETTYNFDNCFNNITVYSEASTVPRGVVFENCRVGVSNGSGGHDTGSPRMGLECYTEDGAPGWQDITLRGCTFEAADAHTVDFSDTAARRSSGVLVEGCLLKGGGWTRTHWGYTINLEMPLGAVIRNNTIWRAWEQALYITDRGDSGYTGPGAVITGNTFDLARDNGITPTGDVPIGLRGDGNQFTNNTITLNYAENAIDLNDCHYNTLTGNIAHIGGRIFAYQFNGSSNNAITGNTVD